MELVLGIIGMVLLVSASLVTGMCIGHVLRLLKK